MDDDRGCPVSCEDREVLALYEHALRQQLTFVGRPVETIEAALALRPDFALGHAFRAGVLMTWSERRFAELARQSVVAAELLGKNDRERGLVTAARLLVEGEWAAACDVYGRVIAEWPRDAFAIQIAHLFDFYRGDAKNLRDRLARALPHWSPGLPGYSHLLGMYAFGLEECHAYAEAEETALRALAIEPRDGWTIHAAAHVMEMQRRVDEGVRFLTSREQHWAPESGFAYHVYWHLALFHLARGDVDRVLEIHDRVFAELPDMSVHLLDASSLLYRLFLRGHDVRSRFAPIADVWASKLESEGGFYAFNDVHAMLAFTAAGRDDCARRLLRELERAADADGVNACMTREVGLPVSRALMAFAHGDHERAAGLLAPVVEIAHRFGGSHAQRDVLRLTLDEARARRLAV